MVRGPSLDQISCWNLAQPRDDATAADRFQLSLVKNSYLFSSGRDYTVLLQPSQDGSHRCALDSERTGNPDVSQGKYFRIRKVSTGKQPTSNAHRCIVMSGEEDSLGHQCLLVRNPA